MNKRKVGSKNPNTSYSPAKQEYSSPQAAMQLSAKGFLVLLKQMEGNLKNCHYHVIEAVCIGNEFFKFSIHLGYGVFENGLSFKGLQDLTYLSLGNSTINRTLRIEESRIGFLRFGSSAIHGQVSLDDITSKGIDFGRARFNGEGSMNKVYSTGPLNLGEAVFQSELSLEDIGAESINAGSANLGKLTLKELYFEYFYTGTATASKVTIQGSKHTPKENLLDTSRIHNQKGAPLQNSLATRLTLAMEEMKDRDY